MPGTDLRMPSSPRDARKRLPSADAELEMTPMPLIGRICMDLIPSISNTGQSTDVHAISLTHGYLREVWCTER